MTAHAKKRRKPAHRRAKRLKARSRAKYLRTHRELTPSELDLVLGLWDDVGDDMRGVLVRFVDSVLPPPPEPPRLPTAHEARRNAGTLLDVAQLPDGCVGDGDLEFVWLNRAGALPRELEWRDLSDDKWLSDSPKQRPASNTLGEVRDGSSAQQLAFEFPPA